MCITQEYMFQTAFLVKAAIIGIICSVTWMVVTNLKLPSRQQFSYRAAVWMLLPVICIPVSIIYETAELFCIHAVQNRSVEVYTIIFLVPLFFCVSLDLFIYFKMRKVLMNLAMEQQEAKHHNPYNAKLLPLIQKLKFFPLAFAISWSAELILMFGYLFGFKNDVIGVLAGIGICSTGVSVSFIYFYHQREHPPVLKLLSRFANLLVQFVMCRCRCGSNVLSEESLMDSTTASKQRSELPMSTVSSSPDHTTHALSVSRSSITAGNGLRDGGFGPDFEDDDTDMVEN